ncbi:hypothetical protein ACTXT7_004898 [Hymenolepis weldensis]
MRIYKYAIFAREIFPKNVNDGGMVGDHAFYNSLSDLDNSSKARLVPIKLQALLLLRDCAASCLAGKEDT